MQNKSSEDHESPPKVDSEVEVLHGNVRKQVIKEGVVDGPLPSKFATCFGEFLYDFLHSVVSSKNTGNPIS